METRNEGITLPEAGAAVDPVLQAQGGRLLAAAALAGAAWPLCFCQAGGRGLNVLVFTAVWFVAAALLLRGLGRWDRGRALHFGGCMGLLALSVCCTMNAFVQTVSCLGILLLMAMLLLGSFCETGRWQLGKYVSAVWALALGGLRRLPDPARLLALRCRRLGWKDRKLRYVLLGLLISLPLAAVALALLCSADAVFRDLFTWDVDLSAAARTALRALGGFVWVFLAFFCVLSGQLHQPVDSETKPVRQREPLVAVTFMGVLGLIYLVFCGVQVIYLFGGRALPSGYTYAGYAREGFFQLLFVSAMNAALVLFCTWIFGRGKALKLVLTGISACTYLMLASSGYRMLLYVSAYGLSFLRVLVLWFLAVLALWLGGIVACIYRARFPLFRFLFSVGLSLWLCFAFARPDYLAAKYNAETFGVTDEVAEAILRDLSEDAAPVMADYAYTGQQFQLAWAARPQVLEEDAAARDPRAFNLALWQAARATRELR